MRRASRPRTPRGRGRKSAASSARRWAGSTGQAGGVKGEVEKGLKAPDAAGAGKEVGGKYSTALGSSATPGTKGSVEKALKSADAEGAGKQVGGRFTGAMKSPLSAITGMIGPMLAVGAGAAIFKTLIDQGGAAVKATKVVEAAIKTTGGAAGVTGAQIEKMAGAQARATGVDKAAIQQSDALLLRYTNVKNAAGANNDVFNRTGQAALDMAAAMGKGTVTAEGLAGTTKILGKAMEDPAKAAGALRRAGVDLTAQQQAAIKTMLAHNDTLGAQKIVLDAVNKSYGGTAAATASGSAKMKVALQELEASLGKQLLPLFAALIKILTQVLNVFGVLVEKFTSNGRAMTIFRDIILGLVAVFAAYTAAVKINAAVTALSAEWTKVAAKATKLFKVETEGATIATRAQAAAQKILDAELIANPIGLIVVAIAALVIGLYELYKHSQAFRDIVHSAWSVVREIAVPAAHALRRGRAPAGGGTAGDRGADRRCARAGVPAHLGDLRRGAGRPDRVHRRVDHLIEHFHRHVRGDLELGRPLRGDRREPHVRADPGGDDGVLGLVGRVRRSGQGSVGRPVESPVAGLPDLLGHHHR